MFRPWLPHLYRLHWNPFEIHITVNISNISTFRKFAKYSVPFEHPNTIQFHVAWILWFRAPHCVISQFQGYNFWDVSKRPAIKHSMPVQSSALIQEAITTNTANWGKHKSCAYNNCLSPIQAWVKDGTVQRFASLLGCVMPRWLFSRSPGK